MILVPRNFICDHAQCDNNCHHHRSTLQVDNLIFHSMFPYFVFSFHLKRLQLSLHCRKVFLDDKLCTFHDPLCFRYEKGD